MLLKSLMLFKGLSAPSYPLFSNVIGVSKSSLGCKVMRACIPACLSPPQVKSMQLLVAPLY